MNLAATDIQAIQEAKRPALLLSFGKDSLLLHCLAKQVRSDIALYYFGDTLSEFATQMIIDNDLTVFNYAPVDRYVVPNGEGVALVDEYILNGTRVPFVSPIVKGDGCTHTLSLTRTPAFRYPHDLTLWGYRKLDWQDAVNTVFPCENIVGGSRFIAPLYEMTDADVFEALETLEIPYGDERNEIEWCDECLTAVIGDDWDRAASLSAFRNRFSFNH